jgi:hypothetical protein
MVTEVREETNLLLKRVDARLLRLAKSEAAVRGVTLKEFVCEAIRRELNGDKLPRVGVGEREGQAKTDSEGVGGRDQGSAREANASGGMPPTEVARVASDRELVDGTNTAAKVEFIEDPMDSKRPIPKKKCHCGSSVEFIWREEENQGWYVCTGRDRHIL